MRSLRSVLALATFGLVLATLVGFTISFELLRRANDGEIQELRQNDRRDVDADDLLNALVDEEVGLRGYLAGGARELLEPYESGLAEERVIRTRLRAEIPGREVPDLEARIDEWHHKIAEPQIRLRETGPLADITASLLADKASFDRIRAAHAALEERLTAFNEAARDDNEHQQRVVRIGAGLLAGAILLLALLGTRYLLRHAVHRAGQQQAIALSKFGEYAQQLTDEAELHETVERVASDIVRPSKVHLMVRNASKNRLEVMRPELSLDEQLKHPILTEPLRCRAVRTLREVAGNATDPTACKCALGVPAEGSYVCVPMLAAGELVGVANFQASEPEHFAAEDIKQLQGYLGFAGATVSSLRLIAATRDRALRDGLTGAYNRAFLGEYLTKVLSSAKRRKTPVSALMLDLDHFKRINDQHGHLAGDRAIVALARTLQKETRGADAVVRYGGEEFVVILVDADAAAAALVAERIRGAVERAEVSGNGIELGTILRTSVGVAAFPDHAADETALLAAADAALYRAKAGGRNRVVVAGEATG